MGDKIRVTSEQPGDSYARCGKVDKFGIASIELFDTHSVLEKALSSLIHKFAEPTTIITIIHYNSIRKGA